MTDKELLAEIRKIIRSRNSPSCLENPDLVRYDRIVGLLRRNQNGVEDKQYATQSDQPRSDAPRLALADTPSPE